jgi:hypothetical protein
MGGKIPLRSHLIEASGTSKLGVYLFGLSLAAALPESCLSILGYPCREFRLVPSPVIPVYSPVNSLGTTWRLLYCYGLQSYTQSAED